MREEMRTCVRPGSPGYSRRNFGYTARVQTRPLYSETYAFNAVWLNAGIEVWRPTAKWAKRAALAALDRRELKRHRRSRRHLRKRRKAQEVSDCG